MFQLALTNGCAESEDGRLLVGPSRNFTVTPAGIEFLGPMSQGQWCELLKIWRIIGSGYLFCLADIISYGKEHFGEEPVEFELGQLEFDFITMSRVEQLGKIPKAQRCYEITEAHYLVLAKHCEDPKEHVRWAGLSIQHGLTAYELQRSILACEVMKGDALEDKQGRNSGVLLIQGITGSFQRWQKQCGGERKILDYPKEQLELLVEELKPAGELYNKVKEKLNAKHI